MKQITLLLLAASVSCMGVTFLARNPGTWWPLTWLVCSAACVGWGIYVWHKLRWLGWVSFGLGVAQLCMWLVPGFFVRTLQ